MEQPTAILNLDDLRKRKLVLADQRKVHEEKLARLALEETHIDQVLAGAEGIAALNRPGGARPDVQLQGEGAPRAAPPRASRAPGAPDTANAILRVLEEHPGARSAREIVLLVQERGWVDPSLKNHGDALRVMLSRLVKRGKIRRPETGKYELVPASGQGARDSQLVVEDARVDAWS